MKMTYLITPFNIDRSFSFQERSPYILIKISLSITASGLGMLHSWGQAIVPNSYISSKVLAFRNEKDKQNQGLMTHHQAGVGIDDLPPALCVKSLELFIKTWYNYLIDK